MSVFEFLTIIGGLALFLYGINIMSGGLQKISGGRLEVILRKLASNPLKAVLLGAGAAAVMQSSSAVSAAAVGLVNSGIMKLAQALEIMLGANIGTTVMAWVLSLLDYSGTSGSAANPLWLRLFTPEALASVLSVAGAFLLLFAGRSKARELGTVVIGFGVLLFGMETVSGGLRIWAEVPEFRNILDVFAHPVLGVAAGLALTAIFQSQMVAVGILQAICASGTVGYATVLPVIIGQNIGTCVTVLLASVGAGKEGRRTAVTYLCIQLLAMVVVMSGFYGFHYLIRFSFMDETANALGVAVVHTLYNILCAVLLLPFLKRLEGLASFAGGPGGDSHEGIRNEGTVSILDIRLLNTPGFALEQCRAAVMDMAGEVRESLMLAIGLLDEYDGLKAERVVHLEEKADHYEDELGTYLLKINGRHLSGRNSQTLSVLWHCIGDLERISDYARNISETAAQMHKKQVRFSKTAAAELKIMAKAVNDAAGTAALALSESDTRLAAMVIALEEVINYLHGKIRRNHIKRFGSGKCTSESSFIFSDIITDYKRIAGHCANMALCLLQLREDSFDTHEYQERLKVQGKDEFQKEVERLKKHYPLQ